MRLLLVERDAATRDALLETLTLAGYSVSCYEDVGTARIAYEDAPFPIAILPMIGEDRRALSVCRAIRAHPLGDHTTVLIATTSTAASALASIVDAGADDFLHIPLNPTILHTRLVLAARRRRKRTLEQARDAALFRQLLESAPDGIVAFDRSGHIVFANREAGELFGLSDDSLVATSVNSLILGPATDDRLLTSVAFADAPGLRASLTVTGRRADGSRFPSEIRLSSESIDGESLAIASIRDVSAQRSTDAALRSSDERLRLALIAAKMGTWDWNLATDALSWSGESEQIAGVDHGGAHTIETFYGLLHPDDRAGVQHAIQNVLASDGDYSAQYRLIMPDGSFRWCEAFGTLERGADGRPRHMRGIVMDMTARKRAEEALREGEERFRAAFEHAAIGMALVALEGSWLRVNSALCDLLGYEADELLATGGFQSITLPDDLEQDLKLLQQLTAGAFETYQLEKRYIRKDGDVSWALLNVSIVHDAAGAPQYFVAQVQDISERKRTEAALSDAHAELGRVIGAVSDCLYSAEMTADGAFSYRYFSPVAERTLGRPADYFLAGQSNLLEIIHPDDRAIFHRAMEQIGTGASPEFVTEYRITLSDGSPRWIQDSVRITRRGPHTLWLDGVLTDITERKAFEAELAHRALHDALTGLPNRPLFLDRLTHALHRRRRAGELSAVLFLDLDNFKTINDGLGHEAGDEVLRAVALRISRRVRTGDTLARFGGDEFVVLLEEIASADDAKRIADELISIFASPIPIQGREVYVGVSIGIALAESHADPSTVLRDADAALYRAKSHGRNRSVVFDPHMTRAALERLELEAELRRALELGEGLVLHYQPVYDLSRRQLCGCEALVRWRHPNGATLYPDAFLPLAEETGLIVPLGEWVLREACQQLRRWQSLYDVPDLIVSVNLSPRNFREPGLIVQIAEVLAETGLTPANLILEVTEHVIVDADARESIAKLKSLGVGLAIDDFGAGHSSLNYLSAIEADFLKIDRRFISGLTANGREAAIVRAVLALGESLNLTVVAEGVETVEQMLALRRMGCDRIQGYLLGRPSPPSIFAGLFDLKASANGEVRSAARDEPTLSSVA